jgi:hypothetical protein
VSGVNSRTVIAMLAAALVGLLAGLFTLKLLGQPTPLG